ncbi:MAG: metallo-mystery pair system four-Cys motif protein [Burkholderiales bacterium]|nr:metallo-mystery pair system four-Cys motif protein [Burkholderiales bacterium]
MNTTPRSFFRSRRPLTALGALTLASLAALSACGGGGDDTPDATAVTIRFAAVAGDQAIRCGTALSGLGTTSASGSLSDLRFYIANVRLLKADGSETPLVLSNPNDNYNATKGSDSVTLIDLEDKTGQCVGTTATNPVIQGSVPSGSYVGVKMVLGVPMSLNHTDQTADTSVTPAAVNNAVHPGMAWSWAGGRKFAKIEATNSSWTASTFNVHLGSTGCTGTNPNAGLVDKCLRPDRLEFTLASFNPATQQIAVDVAALLSGNDVTVNGGGPTGCMSGATDPECVAIFQALALGLDNGATVANGAGQRLFRVISQ